MKLAVSNIAWPAQERDTAYGILADAGITGLEIAPALFLPGVQDPFVPEPTDVDAALGAMQKAGLQLVSMQSLLFGVTGAALFGSASELETLCIAMRRAIGLAKILAIPNLVFGSPRQRVRPDAMPVDVAWSHAVDVFRRLGDHAAAAGTRIAIEPNGKAYGTNFLNRVEEAQAFVEQAAHPAIVLNFDVGALHMEGDFDRIEQIATASAATIGHVHLSEAGLAPAPTDAHEAARVLRALEAAGYAGWYSIEMAATPAPMAALEVATARLNEAVSLAFSAGTTQ